MKKFFATLIIILIAGSSGAGFFLYQKNKQAIRSYPPVYSADEKNAAQLIPDGAAMVLLFKGLGEAWGGLSRTTFFLQLAEYRVAPALTSLIHPQEGSGIKEKLKYFLSEEIFLGAFGQDAALAIFPSGKEKFSFLIVTKTGPLFSYEEFLGKKYLEYFGNGNFTRQQIGNLTATTIPAVVDGFPLHYSLVNGAMIMSNSLDTLKLSLGIAEGGEIARIVDSPLFAKSVGKSMDVTRYGVYVDNKKIDNLVPAKKTPSQEIGGNETVLGASFSRISLDKGITVQTDFFAEPEQIAAWSNSWVSAPPDVFRTPHFLPSEAMLYFGTQKLNTGEVFKYLKEKLLPEDSLFQIPFLLEGEGKGDKNGISWEKEMLPLLGQEWCLALVGNGKAENHMPSLVMAFEVKNVQQAAQMAKKLFSSENPALEKRIYKEFEINHIKNGFLTPLEYFFSENFLFIATGENGSNNLIDTIQQERPSLEKNKIYSSSGVSLNSHFLLFFDAAKLSALAKSGIENAPLELLSGFAKTDPKPEEVLYLASVVESLAMDTVFTLEKIKLKSYIALKDLPSVRKKGVPVPDTKTMVVAKAAPPPQKEIPLEQEPSATKKVVEQEPQKPEVVLPDEKEKEKIEATPMGKKIVPPPSAPEASLPQPPQPPLSEEEKISPPPAEETIILPPEKEGEIKTTAKEDESKEPEEGAKEEPKGEKVEPKVEFVYQSTDDTGQQLRDPFASLIDIEVSKVVPTVDISSLWKELSKVEPINLYLYSHAQKDDPKLINAIENLTEYFKDSKKLEKKPEEEVNKKLEEYSSTVARLNSQYKAKIISPLNFDLDSLSLVGIIMGEKQNIALVQASDQKGYTLKTNDIVGTDYGKVMSITRDQVTIEANFRDYIGKISTKSKKLKLMKEEE